MNRVKSSIAVAIVALTLTADAAALGGTDPEPPLQRPKSVLRVIDLIQIAFSVARL